MIQNPELELAWNFVEKTNQNIFLTGKAGTGKTTFLHKVREESYKRLVVVAPTGVAAINAKGVTIHSFFQMPFGPILPSQAELQDKPSKNNTVKSRYQNKFNRQKIDIIRSLDLLIIDEISMVRADLLDGIDQILRQYRDKNKVFGGVQLLMIGDLQQLAPVVKPDEWQLLAPYYDTAFFFSSKSFQNSNVLGIELKHIYRQKNEKFINILNEIRNNCLSDQSMEMLNSRYDNHFKPDPEEGYITLTTHNARADQMNDQELLDIKGKSHFFTAEVNGDFPEFAYPTHLKLELKVGAQVMFIKNDSSPEKRYFNGKIGKIIQIEEDHVVVRCPDDESDIYTSEEIWNNINYSIDEQTKEIKENIKGSFSQLPLRLAWAITIHKSQGLTFEKAIIDAAASFAHGQTYVALSRCKTLEGIVLKSRINAHGIIQDEKVLTYSHEVENNPPDEKQFNQSQKSYQLELIWELFNYKPFLHLINNCDKIVNQSSGSLLGNIKEPLQIIKEKGALELVTIGENFQNQLVRLSQGQNDLENHPGIQERIKKAIPYFAKHTEEFFAKPFSEISYTTDNKEIKKAFKEALNKLEEQIKIKLFCLEGLNDGFGTTKYLELRAKSILHKSRQAKTSERVDTAGPRPELFSILRELRHQLAKSKNVEHFQIFSQKSLLDLCEKLPADKESLREVHGMGKIRIQKYGDEILEAVNEYCKKNQEEPSTKSPSKKQPKENTKNISLEMFKKGMTIQEIAQERGFVESTIEGHLGTFILSGELKLDEIMNPEKATTLKSLIQNTEFSSLSELRNKLNDEYSYGEIRMVLDDIQYLQAEEEKK